MGRRHQASTVLRALLPNEADCLCTVLDTQFCAVALFDSEGLHLDANKQLCALLGYEPEQLLGKSPFQLYWPQDEETKFRKFFDVETSDRRLTMSLALQPADGKALEVRAEMSRHPIDSLSQPLYVLRFQSTADESLEAKALRESEERYRALSEHSPYGIFVHSGGAIQYVNEVGVRMWRGPHEELVSSSLLTLVHPDYRDEVMERMVTMLSNRGDAPPLREKLLRKDGTTMLAEVKGSQIQWNGKPAVQLVVRDISEEVDQEARRDQVERLESIGNLTASVAHDFNNLLTVIVSSCSLAARRCVGHKALLRDLEAVQIAAQRGGALTKQLLAFGRKQEASIDKVSIHEIISAISLLLNKLLGNKIRWTLTAQPGLWVSKIRPLQVEQVLMNLASNAKTAMPNGGTIKIDLRNTLISSSTGHQPLLDDGLAPGSYVELRFTDSGVGMDDTILSRVFENSFTTGADTGGSGLGLATVFYIMKENGGIVVVDSELDQGTCFRAFFPSAPTSGTRSGSEKQSETNESRPLGQVQGHETILIIEDEKSVRESTRAILEVHGYRVIEADGCMQARAILADMIADIDLVLSDVALLDGAGPEVVEQALQERPTLAVLYMTGYASSEMLDQRKRSLQAPMLSKPFEPAVLCAKIRELLDATK